MTVRRASRIAVVVLAAACRREVDAPPAHGPLRHYHGTLAQTAPVAFGGAPYCDYEVAMRAIVVDLYASADAVAAAELADRSVESVDEPCTIAPARDALHHVFLDRAHRPTRADGALVVPLAPDPRAPVVAPLAAIEVALRRPVERGGADATAHVAWRRIDQGPPLAWVVEADVPLAEVPCTPGRAACVGDVALGCAADGTWSTSGVCPR